MDPALGQVVASVVTAVAAVAVALIGVRGRDKRRNGGSRDEEE